MTIVGCESKLISHILSPGRAQIKARLLGFIPYKCLVHTSYIRVTLFSELLNKTSPIPVLSCRHEPKSAVYFVHSDKARVKPRHRSKEKENIIHGLIKWITVAEWRGTGVRFNAGSAYLINDKTVTTLFTEQSRHDYRYIHRNAR